jgi:NAD-specific glutamate dehydrogenase
MQWLSAHNLVFRGYREYSFPGEGDDQMVQVVPGTGLGILSDEDASSFSQP